MSTLGKPLERVEDAALLMGRGRYIDDMPVAPGTRLRKSRTASFPTVISEQQTLMVDAVLDHPVE